MTIKTISVILAGALMLFCAASTIGCCTRLQGGAQGKGIHNDNGEMKMAGFYDYTLTSGTGETVKMDSFRGKVVLVVNTATGCGFTPQYAPIEQLYKDYHDKGLEILDIPCNQFGGQAPGTDDEIHSFCTLHYNTTFPQMKKADVNGANELPLYTFLKSRKGFGGFDEHKYKKLLEEMFASDALLRQIMTVEIADDGVSVRLLSREPAA